MLKVIKTEADYKAAMAAVERLIDAAPAEGTREAQELELLAVLVEDYERKDFELGPPTAVEAIRFRMEQQGLAQKDLVPFIGSRSKVSEILSGKRPLTLPMIRALHLGLGIPAHVLVNDEELPNENLIEWSRFPIVEMVKRGWVNSPGTVRDLLENAESILTEFFHPVGSPQRLLVLYRQTAHVRGGRSMDRYALAAWTAQIMRRATALRDVAPYVPGTVTPAFIAEIVRLSPYEDGPRRAQALLARHGIILVLERQLPRTNLDGAAVLLDNGRPVIGLTLRHDRIDNFWFSLAHELAHIALHFDNVSGEVPQFFDDLEVGPGSDSREIEADQVAGESLIPEKAWTASAASKVRAIPAIHQLAHQLKIHPAIIAGRMRHQYKDFRVLGSLVGQGEIQRQFPEMTDE